jgi:hypothetical protein
MTIQIAEGADVLFPRPGPTSSTGITALNSSSFNIATIGVYNVSFQVSVNEPGQLLLTLNGVDINHTVVGRATGTTQLVGLSLVIVSVPNSILTVRNPSGNTPPLTITPYAGGARTVSASLIIVRVS